MSNARTWPAPWVFSLLILPLGMAVGFILTPLPFLLAKAGVPVDRIATINAVGMSPGFLGFLIAPVVDIKLRRRTWLAIGIFGTAVAACIYFPLIGASHVVLITAVIFAGGMVSFLVMAGCGGLMVRMLTSTDQSKAAGWIQAGLLGGGTLSAAIVFWLVARLPLLAAGLCFAVLIALSGVLPFTIPEPVRQLRRGSRGISPQSAQRSRGYSARANADGVRCFCFRPVRPVRRKVCCPQLLRIMLWAGRASCG